MYILTLCMVLTARRGNFPLDVSPDNMIQSTPSKTALATSLLSARVGLGFCIILSNICDVENKSRMRISIQEYLVALVYNSHLKLIKTRLNGITCIIFLHTHVG